MLNADLIKGANTLKPESGLAFELQAVPIRTIAHWILASRQILDDAPQLRATIDNELLYQLGFVEDAQLLTGGGTGTDLGGIYTQATAFSAGSLVVADPNRIDAIGAAILQNALAEIPATGIALHPADWMGICLTKDADGRYLVGMIARMAMKDIGTIFWAALQQNHKMSREEASDLVDHAGLNEVIEWIAEGTSGYLNEISVKKDTPKSKAKAKAAKEPVEA